MFQLAVITLFFSLHPAQAEETKSRYLKEWAKAQREYSYRVSNASRQGKVLTSQERRAMYKEIFKEAHKAYQEETLAFAKKVYKSGKDLMRELNNTSPAEKSPDQATRASSASKASSTVTPSRVGSTSSGDVDAGAAENVSFGGKAPPTPATAGSASKSGTASGEEGGAQEVTFGGGGAAKPDAKAPADSGPSFNTKSEGADGAQAVEFGKPAAAPAAADPKAKKK
jgi:hypothetical protein